MNGAYEKTSCPHCGQHIEYPADAAADSAECPNCSRPVPLCKKPPRRRQLILIGALIFCCAIAGTILAMRARSRDQSQFQNKHQPEGASPADLIDQILLLPKAEEVWKKADAGDMKAQRELGKLYWTAPTNFFLSPELRIEMIKSAQKGSLTFDNATGEVAVKRVYRLFNKADTGDREAQGELVMVWLGDLFHTHQLVKLRGTNTEPRNMEPIERKYMGSTDTDILRLKTFTIGPNTDSRVADVVNLEITRSRYLSIGDSVGYRANINIHGTAPVAVDEGDSIRVEVDGKTFFWKKELPANAETNSLGAAIETMLVTVSFESIHALTNCSSVVIHFDGLLRRLDVPLTTKNVEYLRMFARDAAKEDAKVYKPVDTRAYKPANAK